MCVEHEHNKKQYTHLLLTVWFFVQFIFTFVHNLQILQHFVSCVIVYGGTYEM